MQKNTIPVPEKGTYKWQLFDYWSGEYRQTHATHNAYIALNFAGALDACKSKFQALVQQHRAKLADAETGARHQRAVERLQNNLSGAAVAYELPFPVTNATSARELAGVVEMRLAATYADLAGATTGSDRNDAVLAARECAVRGITWGAPTAAFPGLD